MICPASSSSSFFPLRNGRGIVYTHSAPPTSKGRLNNFPTPATAAAAARGLEASGRNHDGPGLKWNLSGNTFFSGACYVGRETGKGDVNEGPRYAADLLHMSEAKPFTTAYCSSAPPLWWYTFLAWARVKTSERERARALESESESAQH